MNLESLGGRSIRRQQPGRKLESRVRRSKAEPQQRVDGTSECLNGTCEVSWKPYVSQPDTAKVSNQ
jgi:hypothetical protein